MRSHESLRSMFHINIYTFGRLNLEDNSPALTLAPGSSPRHFIARQAVKLALAEDCGGGGGTDWLRTNGASSQ